MKKMLTAGIIILGIGLVLVLVGFGMNGFRLPTHVSETNTYTVTEDFSDISVNIETADVRFLPAEGETCTAVCKEQQKYRFAVTSDGSTLSVTCVDTRKWYERIFTLFTPSVTVYLPKNAYGALSVHLTTGDTEVAFGFLFDSVSLHGTTGDAKFFANVKNNLSVETTTGRILVSGTACADLDACLTTGSIAITDTSCSALTIRLTTGDTRLTNTTCAQLQMKATTGDITLTNTLSFGRIDIQTSTGNVRFNASDGAELFVKTNTGNITGTLVTDKVFLAHTDTGRVRVPKTTTGGRCELTTDTGNILLDIAPPDATVPDEVFETAPLVDPPAEE
ncbi:MAG: DUF4097 family beta strand repeat protein [Clostridia bacterium]|nr:DUF4097 family beta strand repeat protein [Clostridia bacterium]